MTGGTHFIFGASMAQLFADNELSAFLIGFAAHALLDALPHNDGEKSISLFTSLAAAVYAYQRSGLTHGAGNERGRFSSHFLISCSPLAYSSFLSIFSR